jgi:hypothetical protein
MKSAMAEIGAYARERQMEGDLWGWSFNEAKSEVEFYVTPEADTSSFPSEIASIHVVLVPLPAPEEQEVC